MSGYLHAAPAIVRNGMLAAEDAHGGPVSFPILTMLVLLPVFGAVAVAISGKRRPEITKLIALITSVATGAMTVWLLQAFETGTGDFQFVITPD